jgi:hypothetical protein
MYQARGSEEEASISIKRLERDRRATGLLHASAGGRRPLSRGLLASGSHYKAERILKE